MGRVLKDYVRKQIEGHKMSEEYALSTLGYINLMKYLRGFIPEIGRILDIGTNTGYEALAIQSKDRQVMGIDIGKEFIEKAKSLGVDARVMDMHNLEFPDKCFDCVYMNNTLEHSHTPSKVISEIFRVLKEGGTAIICIPADYKNLYYFAVEKWDKTLHLWKPDNKEFNKSMVDAGFESVIVHELDAEALFGLENRASRNHYLVAICKK